MTHVANETSQEGFDAEWRVVSVFTVEGDMVNRCEVFDEAAIDDAIARFEELSRPAPRLENTASRANARLIAYVNARDWDSAASILADDHYSDDRRRVTGAGIRRGRDADIENFRVVADLGANITVEVIATRGDRLVLTRTRVSRSTSSSNRLSLSCSASSRPTSTAVSRLSSSSTSTTSTPPSRNSTPDTSPAKRPLTRARGR